MAETTPRVVVLARPGKAADNLADALRQAGADLVAVLDPSGLDHDGLLAHRPQAVLVALEPGIEAAVEALDDVLSSPELTVIFDEADIAAQRAGWDAARWVRHLSAKLHRHSDVLPPGAEPEPDMMPMPGSPPTPASIHAAGLDIAPFAREAEGRAGSVPADELRQERGSESAPPVPASPAATAFAAPETFRLDDVAAEPALAMPTSAVSSPDSVAPTSALALDDDAFFLETLSSSAAPAGDAPVDFGDSGLSLEPMSGETGVGSGLGLDLDDGSGFAEEIDAGELNEDELRAFEQAMRASAGGDADAQSEDEPPAFDTSMLQDLGFDPALLEPIQPDAPAAPSLSVGESLHDFDFTRAEPPAPAEPAPARAPSPPGIPDFSSLSLAEDDAGPLQPSVAAAPAPRHDLGELERRISGLSLVDIEPSVDESEPVAPPVSEMTALRSDDIGEIGGSRSPVAPMPPAASEAAPAYEAYAPAPAAPPFFAPPAAPPPVLPPPLPVYEAPPVAAAPVTAAPVTAAPVASAEPVGTFVLVEAGLGGPDPVRQLLAGLPAHFRIPIVVRLQLQGGRYDRLVTQMERAAALPVSLATPDQPLVPGRIHFLPDGVGLRNEAGGMRFDVAFTGSDSLYDTLAALDDGALVFLSGSDPGLVDRAASLAAAGTLVVAQSPEDCYDGVACAQLRGRGVPVAAAPELAARLAQHWPH